MVQGGVLSLALFKGEDRIGTRRSSVSSALKLLSGQLSNTASEHQADQVRRWHYHLHIRTSGGWPNQWPQHIPVANAQLHQQQKLTVSTAKSTATLITQETHEHHLRPQVKLSDQVLPVKKKQRVLGVMLDTNLTITQHCNNIAVIVQQRNNVLKALAGSTCCKKTKQTTYQAIGRSILSYCCPVWTPSHKDTNWSRHQRAQNSVLRITNGCLKMADVTELHQEAWKLPVRQNNELISQQFTIACHLPQHPCHQLCHRPPDDRPERRRSLIDKNYAGTTAHRSSWILGQYMNRIDPTARNHCHNCGQSPHDTHHLFNCPSKPTTLTVESRWTVPTETAKHLNLAIDETS